MVAVVASANPPVATDEAVTVVTAVANGTVVAAAAADAAEETSEGSFVTVWAAAVDGCA
jgi:hypothetical protein